MLKLVQVPSRAQSRKQYWSEDVFVSFATSTAHIAGPSLIFLDLLKDTSWTESIDDVTGITTPSSRSSSIGTIISFICERTKSTRNVPKLSQIRDRFGSERLTQWPDPVNEFLCFELRDYFGDNVLLVNAFCQKSLVDAAHIQITQIYNVK